MKVALLGIGAVALGAAASVLGVWWATRPGPSPSLTGQAWGGARPGAAPPVDEAAEPAGVAPPSTSPAPPPEAASAPAQVRRAPVPLAQVRRAPARAAPAGTAWEEIAPVPLRRLPAISRALEQARPRLARCFDPEEQARQAHRPYTAIGSPGPGRGGAVLVLQLEAAPGRPLHVVDAPIESRGAAEDGLLACAQDALRGLELGFAGGGDPVRMRVRYPLSPVTSGAAVTRPAPRVRLRPR